LRVFAFILLIAFISAGCQRVTTRRTDSGVPDVPSPIKEVSPTEAEGAVSKAYAQFVDVRTPDEYAAGHAARSVNIPLDTLSTSFDKLEKSEPVYVICQTGVRSGQAAEILKGGGFNNVLSVTGGTTAWEAAGLPMETKPPHRPIVDPASK
jgi:rhodanese-related sulfurtransferase